jgi:GR25 family glycosyltransferase involved in LPS biosynthesis
MKYLIMHVNDRAIKNIEYNKNILKDFDYVSDVKYFNGNLGNGRDILNHIGINCDAWSPYDGRTSKALPGEYGIWVSVINIWQYMIDNKIDKLLVLEDDIKLKEDFIKNLTLCLNDLPNDFDFLSLFHFNGQAPSNSQTEIGSEYIQKSITQYSATQATIYSLSGAKKLMKLIKRKGLEYTTDCFIFRQSKEGLVSGYSIKKSNTFLLSHEHRDIKSLIDPDNIRKVDMD